MAEAKDYTVGLFKLTSPVAMIYPHLFVPQAYKEKGKAKGEPKYSARLLFPADSQDLKDLKALAAKLARAEWPDKAFNLKTVPTAEHPQGQTIPQISFPFKSGDAAADKKGGDSVEYMRGKVLMSAKSKNQPQLGYITNGRIIELNDEAAMTAAKGQFYSGVQVYAELNLSTFPGAEGKLPGVTVYLNAILSTGKGERIASAKSISNTFKGYAGIVSAQDPTAPGAGDDVEDDMVS